MNFLKEKIKRFLNHTFSVRQALAFLLVFAVLGGGFAFYKSFMVKGATYSWLQTSWTGGATTTAKASHLTDQTGWTKYFSKDTLLSTSTPGVLSLTATTTSSIDTTFSVSSSTSNTYVSSGTVYLKKPNGVACTSPNECATGLCHTYCGLVSVGDSTGGGIVFYITDGGAHGLIASTSDVISVKVEWGCTGADLSGASSNTDGAQNTIDIANNCSTSGIAAKRCADATSDGYTDWYLPAFQQLQDLYTQRATVGNFFSSEYWSSTENSDNGAGAKHFGTGDDYDAWKYNIYRVRCIRSF